MTEEEKRQQRAMLLLEFEEATDNLASLREKAGRIGRDILEVGTWLASMSAERGPSVETNRIENSRRDQRIRDSLSKYKSAMGFEDAVSLMNEIAGAEKILSDLAFRKRELGAK